VRPVAPVPGDELAFWVHRLFREGARSGRVRRMPSVRLCELR